MMQDAVLRQKQEEEKKGAAATEAKEEKWDVCQWMIKWNILTQITSV